MAIRRGSSRQCSFVGIYGGYALADEIIEHLEAHSFRLGGAVSPSYASNRGPVPAEPLCAR